MKIQMSKYDYQTILDNWNIKEQQQRVNFMEHLYDVYKPDNNCYTGLWQRFCLEEAGGYCRQMYFDRLDAVKKFIESQQPKEST
jgi:hypothetical protein